jgi:hypothetical protein
MTDFDTEYIEVWVLYGEEEYRLQNEFVVCILKTLAVRSKA